MNTNTIILITVTVLTVGLIIGCLCCMIYNDGCAQVSPNDILSDETHITSITQAQTEPININTKNTPIIVALMHDGSSVRYPITIDGDIYYVKNGVGTLLLGATMINAFDHSHLINDSDNVRDLQGKLLPCAYLANQTTSCSVGNINMMPGSELRIHVGGEQLIIPANMAVVVYRTSRFTRVLTKYYGPYCGPLPGQARGLRAVYMHGMAPCVLYRSDHNRSFNFGKHTICNVTQFTHVTVGINTSVRIWSLGGLKGNTAVFTASARLPHGFVIGSLEVVHL